MRFLIYEQLRMEKGIPYSNRQLKRLEAKGTFPKRVPLAAGKRNVRNKRNRKDAIGLTWQATVTPFTRF